MDQGTLAYMIDGQYLGVAFSGLNNLNKPLYPIVSAVWGHCEVEMSYTHGPQEMTLQSMARYEIRRSMRHMFYQLKMSMGTVQYENSHLMNEVNSNNNGNCCFIPSSAAVASAVSSLASQHNNQAGATHMHCAGPSSSGAGSAGAPRSMSSATSSIGSANVVMAPSHAPSIFSQITSGMTSILPGRQMATSSNASNLHNNANSSIQGGGISSFRPNHPPPTLWSSASNPFPISESTSHNSQEAFFKCLPPTSSADSIALASSCFKSQKSALTACLMELNNGNVAIPTCASSKDLNAMLQHHISAMGVSCFMDAFPFQLLPPGCNSDAQFIQHHVENLQIPTCLKHYLT